MFGGASDVCKSAKAFIDVIKMRRTIYDIGSDLPVQKSFVVSSVKDAIKHIPSSFNSQSNRAVVIFGKQHCELWEKLVWNFIETAIPKEKQGYFQGKFNGFKAGAGTILFYIDKSVVEKLQAQTPGFKDSFPIWARDSISMAQFAVWSTLAAAKIGASLQHYTDESVQAKLSNEYKIPESWKLCALMPFGSIKTMAGEKKFVPTEETVKVIGEVDS